MRILNQKYRCVKRGDAEISKGHFLFDKTSGLNNTQMIKRNYDLYWLKLLSLRKEKSIL